VFRPTGIFYFISEFMNVGVFLALSGTSFVDFNVHTGPVLNATSRRVMG